MIGHVLEGQCPADKVTKLESHRFLSLIDTFNFSCMKFTHSKCLVVQSFSTLDYCREHGQDRHSVEVVKLFNSNFRKCLADIKQVVFVAVHNLTRLFSLLSLLFCLPLLLCVV